MISDVRFQRGPGEKNRQDRQNNHRRNVDYSLRRSGVRSKRTGEDLEVY